MVKYEQQLEYRISKQEDIIRSLVEEIKTLEAKVEESRFVYSIEWVIEDECYEKIYAFAKNFEDACRRLFSGIKSYKDKTEFMETSKATKSSTEEFLDLDYWWVCITNPSPDDHESLQEVEFAVQVDPEGNIMTCMDENYYEIFERVKKEV